MSRPEREPQGFRLRVAAIVLAGVAVATVVLLLPLIPQPQSYHDLADTRVILGIPCFGDVATHVLYLAVGLIGLWWVWSGVHGRRPEMFAKPAEAWNYAAFFLGFTLTAFGSTWYHLNPCDSTLYWDRLAMSITFVAFFAVMIAERISLRASLVVLPIAEGIALACITYWRLGGDLRFYFGLVQGYPMLAIVLMMLLFRPRYSHSEFFWWMFATYALAVVFEQLDRPIYELTGVVSGHNLKHVCVAGGIFWIALMLRRRRPLRQAVLPDP